MGRPRAAPSLDAREPAPTGIWGSWMTEHVTGPQDKEVVTGTRGLLLLDHWAGFLPFLRPALLLSLPEPPHSPGSRLGEPPLTFRSQPVLVETWVMQAADTCNYTALYFETSQQGPAGSTPGQHS